jgi:trimethylamine---corrinoid protein Co-methyltransferase
LLAALAGANQIYGAGMIESGVAFDFGQLVMDDEIARMIRQCTGGIRVDEEALAVDDIKGVGSSGDFLSLAATLRHMRELSLPQLLDRRVRDEWEIEGASDLYLRSRRRALELLESHRAEPLDADVDAELQRMFEAAGGAPRSVATPGPATS